MRKEIIVAAAASFVSVASICPSTAHAQSKVTLYGILDEGLVYQSNTGGATGGKRISLDSLSGEQGSRWGLTGAEDLGGDAKAIFTLESGININNGAFGQGGTAFGRQAFVGLSSSRLGSVTLGRQYDMIAYFVTPYVSTGVVGTAGFGHPGDLDNTFNSIRMNNSVRYMSPNFGGLTFGAEYGFGGVAGNFTANSGYSLGTSYLNGPLILNAAFTYFKNPTSATPGSGFFTNNQNGVSTLAGSLNRGYSSASAYQVGVVGLGYNIGPMLILASFSNIQYANLGPTFRNGTARFNNAELTTQYKYSPALLFTATYDYLIGKAVTMADGRVVGGQHYNQISAAADYFLSKRTDVYLVAAWQEASGTSSIGAPAVANFTNQGESSNDHQLYLRLGIRHKF
ncbi:MULTISPECIES: porin [unclassified Caballeronia]|uniref:porin n=1 Tax=unclassified Caballeronia TaxID=2646786 RepID=UPI00285D4FAD|nr:MULTISPECIES: porin [unclassified Caballeronia]MDR5752415.1 porin [Caballeronia sp. LZ024]MDR5845221.1 porin [Caballeronia sp. LZ031]